MKRVLAPPGRRSFKVGVGIIQIGRSSSDRSLLTEMGQLSRTFFTLQSTALIWT